MDRYAYVQGVRHNGAIVGAALMPPPQGTWGLPERELKLLPGYRGSDRDKAEARKLLAAAGVTPARPLRIELTTRSIAIDVDLASFVADQLRLVGIEATVKQMDTAQYFPALTRREFQIGANLTASGIDDPDGNLYENYRCGAARNYTDYCNEEMDKLIAQRVLRQLALREEPASAQLALQLRAHAGSVARPLTTTPTRRDS
jgi:peptide/nickel transport system substrate-binding protein